MNKFTEFFEQHEKVKTFAFNKLLSFIEKLEEPINKGNTRAKKRLYNHLRDPNKVSDNLLLRLYFHTLDSTKNDPPSNIVNFPRTGEDEEMVAEASLFDEKDEDDETDKVVDLDALEYPDYEDDYDVKGESLSEKDRLIVQATADRLGKPANKVTHSGLVRKLKAMAEMKNINPSYKRKPVLLYGPAGIGKTEGVQGYSQNEAMEMGRLFVELPVQLLVAGQEKHQLKMLTAYNEPNSPVSAPVSWNEIQANMADYYLFITARPTQLNPLMFGGLPGEEPVYQQLMSDSLGKYAKDLPNEKELKKLNKTQTKNNRAGGHTTHEHGAHKEKHLRIGSRTVIDVPGDFQTLIQAKDKFADAVGMIFVDEITRIDDQLFFNMLMPYLEADNMYNSDAFAMVAAGNAGKGFTNVTTIDDVAQKDRFESILYFQYDPDEFLDYIKKRKGGLHPAMEKWVYSNSAPFDSGGERTYNTELDEKYNGKTYAIPSEIDRDDDTYLREEYEKQIWTPRRFVHVNDMWNHTDNHLTRMMDISNREENHETKGTEDWEQGIGLDDEEKDLLYSGEKRFDPQRFINDQIENILTTINIQEISDDLNKYVIDHFSHSTFGVQVKGAQSASVVADFISDAIISLPGIEDMPLFYIERLDNVNLKAPLGAFFHLNVTRSLGLSDNPFGKFNFNNSGGKYTSTAGLKDAIEHPTQGADTAIQISGHVNETLHERIAKPLLSQISEASGIFTGGADPQKRVNSSLNISITDEIIRELWLLGHIGKRLQVQVGLKLGEDVEGELNGTIASIYKSIGLKSLHSFLKEFIDLHSLEVAPTPGYGEQDLNSDIGDLTNDQSYSGGISAMVDPSKVLIQHVNVNVPELKIYNPEFVAMKMILVLLEVINEIWPGAGYNDTFSDANFADTLQKHGMFINDFISGDIQKMMRTALSNHKEEDVTYNVSPGGILGGVDMKDVRKSAPKRGY